MRTRSKKNRGLVTRTIAYRHRQHPAGKPQQIKVEVRRDEQIDTGYAAAIVAVRTGTPLTDVIIIDIREPDR